MNDKLLNEKSKSKSQQKLFGMVHAFQKGKLKHASPKIKKIAKEISEKDAEDFAKTKHDGLPDRIKLKSFKEWLENINENSSPIKKFFYGKSGEIQIQCRCEGTKQQYWTIKVLQNGECIATHTSKNLAYINEMHGRYKMILQQN